MYRFLMLLTIAFAFVIGCAAGPAGKIQPEQIVEPALLAWDLGCSTVLVELVNTSCDADAKSVPVWAAVKAVAAVGSQLFGSQDLAGQDVTSFIESLDSKPIPIWLITSIKGIVKSVIDVIPLGSTTTKLDPYARDSLRRIFQSVESAVSNGLDGCLAQR
jgi:hypothetical protein